MYVKGIRSLFSFPGYVVSGISMSAELVQVNLRRDGRYGLPCPRCGAMMGTSRTKLQTARDLPLGTALAVLVVYEAVQGRCCKCGGFSTIHPPGIDDHARATRRLMEFVSRLARFLPLSRIQEVVPVDDATAFRWDKAILKDKLPPPAVDDLRVLLIDEKAVRKHHGYVTLVMNGITGELLYLAEGKKKESLQGFFDKLTNEQKASIVAVGMDRAGAYHEVVKEQLPKADIVFDKFHLIANYHAVIDEVRREEWRHAKGEYKDVIKGQRYNLFRNASNRTSEQTQSLMNLLHMNRNLAVCYILKDYFRQLWDYKHLGPAAKYFTSFIQYTMVCGVEAVRDFGQRLIKAKDEILNFTKHHITTGPLEGFNNTISRIIHRACGVANLDYLFLKLRQESLEPDLPK
jgi:transposase